LVILPYFASSEPLVHNPFLPKGRTVDLTFSIDLNMKIVRAGLFYDIVSRAALIEYLKKNNRIYQYCFRILHISYWNMEI